MSELTKAILVNSINSSNELYYRSIPRRATAVEMMKVGEHWTTDSAQWHDTKIYSIEAKIGHKVYIDSLTLAKAKSEGQVLHEATQNAKKAIVECVFGEFREYFILIGLALHDYDIVKARDLLYKMEQQMFTLDE